MRFSFFCFLVVFCLCLGEDTDGSVKGRGFGDGYQWRSFKHGIKEAEVAPSPISISISIYTPLSSSLVVDPQMSALPTAAIRL